MGTARRILALGIGVTVLSLSALVVHAGGASRPPGPPPCPQPCAGDCRDDGATSIDELLVMVRIALGRASLDDCAAGDKNRDGTVAISDLIAAVLSALAGCPSPEPCETATVTPTETSSPMTPTATPLDTATTTPSPTATAQSVAEQLEALGFGDRLGITHDSMDTNGEWEQYHYDPAREEAICLEGAQFQVNLHRGSANKLFIYLEGGGACWDFYTCYEEGTVRKLVGPAPTTGVLNPGNPNNPLRDWNIVDGGNCDGSLWRGNGIVEYEGRRTFHHGLQNLSALVGLALREVPNPELILIAGDSAGGYGTYLGYAITRVAYPNTPILVLNDSGTGLQNPDTPEVNAARAASWNDAMIIPPDCSECTAQLTYLTDWALQRDAMLRVGYYSTLQDVAIRSHLSTPPTYVPIDGAVFQSLLVDTTDIIRERHPDTFKRFFVSGTAHTVLQRPRFYTLQSGGTSLRDWTADFIANGPKWTDIVEQ